MKSGSVLGPCLSSLGHSQVHRAYIKTPESRPRWCVGVRAFPNTFNGISKSNTDYRCLREKLDHFDNLT